MRERRRAGGFTSPSVTVVVMMMMMMSIPAVEQGVKSTSCSSGGGGGDVRPLETASTQTRHSVLDPTTDGPMSFRTCKSFSNTHIYRDISTVYKTIEQ